MAPKWGLGPGRIGPLCAGLALHALVRGCHKDAFLLWHPLSDVWGRTYYGGVPCAVRALCEKLAVLHHREFGKFRRLKGRH